MECNCGGQTENLDGLRTCYRCGRNGPSLVRQPRAATHIGSQAPQRHRRRRFITGGIRKWRSTENRSNFDYSKLEDEILFRMKHEAMADFAPLETNLGLARGIEKTGLDGVNRELWRRGLTEAQQRKSNSEGR